MARTLSKVLGVVFILVGILGFFQDPILGLFEVDLVHNLVHLVSGVALVALAGATALRVVGVVYLLVTVLGFAMGEGDLLGLMHVNAADNWLHLVLAVALIGASFAKGSSSAPAASNPSTYA